MSTKTDQVDVIIVGSGASGAAAAWSLSHQSGLRIVCLEQGDAADPSRYPSTHVAWELERRDAFSSDPNVRGAWADYPIECSDSPISLANYNGFGGSTVLYSGHFPRFHPSDFRVRSLDGIASDWPFSYAELEPYFERNERMMGVAGLIGDPAYPPYKQLLPPVPIGRAGQRVAKGFDRLAWHWWPSYSAINTAHSGTRPSCINLGPCNSGCAQGAKGSVDVTYWPEAMRRGVTVLRNSRVLTVELNAAGLAETVIYATPDGAHHRLRARLVVLAASGAGTPRLLLNSRSAAFPDGLLNEQGLVGSNLMLHPLAYTEAVFDEDLESSVGPQGCCIYSHEFYETDPGRDFVRGYTMQVLRGAPALETAQAGWLMRRIPMGAGHHEAFAKLFNRTVGIAVIAEDLPSVHNRITLDPSHPDSSGMPGVKVSYTLSENTRRMLQHGMKASRKVLETAGGRVLSSFAPVRHTGWHIMGTARMGISPRDSVVDADGRAHAVPNLFVVDSSVFVTSGAVNPVATAQAVTLYLCERIRQALDSTPTPC